MVLLVVATFDWPWTGGRPTAIILWMGRPKEQVLFAYTDADAQLRDLGWCDGGVHQFHGGLEEWKAEVVGFGRADCTGVETVDLRFLEPRIAVGGRRAPPFSGIFSVKLNDPRLIIPSHLTAWEAEARLEKLRERTHGVPWM